jgi:uncharacterized membrane protein
MSWHPVAVHFPIALLSFGFLVDVVALVTGRGRWHRSGYLLLVAGTLGAAISVVTGNLAAADFRATTHAEAIQDHEDFGTVVLLLYLVSSLGRLPRYLRAEDTRLGAGWIVLGIVAFAVLVATSQHGGALVYERGVGILGPPP